MSDRVPNGKLTDDEWKIYGKSKEYLIVWNPNDSTPIDVIEGDEDGVSAPRNRFNELRGKVAFSHNHPIDCPPDLNDIFMDILWEVKFSRIITETKLYEITPPEGGWNINIHLDRLKKASEQAIERYTDVRVEMIEYGGLFVPGGVTELRRIEELFETPHINDIYYAKILPDIFSELGASISIWPIIK